MKHQVFQFTVRLTTAKRPNGVSGYRIFAADKPDRSPHAEIFDTSAAATARAVELGLARTEIIEVTT